MRVGITGFGGMVGRELLKFPETFPLDVDVRDTEKVEKAVQATRPDLIVHLAAISKIEDCENEKNKRLVIDTNYKGTANVAMAGEKYDCGVVLLSSVHVFDGLWGNYKETSKPHPKNYYGYSKMTAEAIRTAFPNLKVVRTSYLFDYQRLYPEVYAMRAGETVEEPMFLCRSFMYVSHFVESLYAYLCRFDEMPDMLHIAGTRGVSRYNFVRDLAESFGLPTKFVKPRMKESNEYTPRPHKGTLNVSKSKEFGLPQYDYRDGLFAVRELI